jgi:hypothetical protein
LLLAFGARSSLFSFHLREVTVVWRDNPVYQANFILYFMPEKRFMILDAATDRCQVVQARSGAGQVVADQKPEVDGLSSW